MFFDDDGLEAWEKNARFWDEQMGDESNFFHRDIVRPGVEELLQINSNDFVLDIACGNGNFSSRMASIGAKVVAFDYSKTMIDLAIKRRNDVLDKVEFIVCDASNQKQLLNLKRDKKYTKAVSNMAVMDICEITSLFKVVYELLDNNGIFVFSTHHPCFTYENNDYFRSCIYKGIAIENQPVLQNYYHRTLSEILQTSFKAGFILDGFKEVPFNGENIPIIMIVRLKKIL